jgi:hypothetical protein
MKLYTEEQVKQIVEKSRETGLTAEYLMLTTAPIELPSDEEMHEKYSAFITTEVTLGFLTKEQGERLKWYYQTYLVNKIQGGNK